MSRGVPPRGTGRSSGRSQSFAHRVLTGRGISVTARSLALCEQSTEQGRAKALAL